MGWVSQPVCALAGTVVITPDEESLRPGVPNRLFVASLDQDSLPSEQPPSVAIAGTGGSIAYLGPQTRVYLRTNWFHQLGQIRPH